MTATPSTMLPLNTPMPSFRLPDFSGRFISTDDFADAKALLVIFMCPHCPFVQHVRSGVARFVQEYQPKGLAVVGINSNDTETFPMDGAEGMKKEALTMGYSFPYLIDATQAVAKSYRAACTPDFFLFDRNRTLVYRGQFDSSRPGNSVPVTGVDLREATDAVLAGRVPVSDQRPSIGCNIKWKRGNEPGYF